MIMYVTGKFFLRQASQNYTKRQSLSPSYRQLGNHAPAQTVRLRTNVKVIMDKMEGFAVFRVSKRKNIDIILA